MPIGGDRSNDILDDEPLLSLEDGPNEEADDEEDLEGHSGGEAPDEEGDGQNAPDGQDEGQGRQRQVAGAPRRESRESAELRRKDIELAETRKQMNDLITRMATPQAPQAPVIDPVLERMRMEAMSPEERVAHMLDQSQQAMQRQMHQQEIRNFDQSDRAAFTVKAASDPRISRFANEVENLFQQELRKGNMLDRSTICKYLIGDAVLAKPASQQTKRQAQGRAAISRQQTRTTNGRSDIGAEGGRRQKTAADRLEGVTF